VSNAWYRERDAPVPRQCFDNWSREGLEVRTKPANSWQRLARGAFHRVRQNSTIVVNTTSSGLFPDTDDRLDIDVDSLQPHLIVADVIPNPPRTQLLRDAESRGATLDSSHSIERLCSALSRSCSSTADVDPAPRGDDGRTAMQERRDQQFESATCTTLATEHVCQDAMQRQ
jgi:hypothetical protein